MSAGHCHACGAPLTPAVSLERLRAALEYCKLPPSEGGIPLAFEVAPILRALIAERLAAAHVDPPCWAHEVPPLLGPDDTHHDTIPPTLRSETP